MTSTKRIEPAAAEFTLALGSLVEPRRVHAMRTRLEELLAVTPQDHAGTLIVGGLLDEEVFDAAWQHPRLLGAVGHLLGDGYRLLGVGSRGVRPGHGQQGLHVDWADQGVQSVWYACHAICPLVDFTHKNGATRVVPGSHKNPWMLKGRMEWNWVVSSIGISMALLAASVLTEFSSCRWLRRHS